MKACPALPIAFYLCLLFAIVLLIITAPTALAATGTARCGDNSTITCNAYQCDCEDNVGCTGYNQNGEVIQSQTNSCSRYAPLE